MLKVRSLEKEATLSVVQARVPDIIAEIKKASQADKPMIYEAISQLSDHPRGAQSLQTYYGALPASAFRDRHFTLAIIGQMRLDKNFEFLKTIVWAPLPAESPRVDQADGLSDRRQEEIVRAKAIHGIGYLRSAEAFSALNKIMNEHESRYLRTIAIDTYLWNHKDDPKVAKALKKSLPTEYHGYVGIPRFTKRTSHIEFERKVKKRQGQITHSK